MSDEVKIKLTGKSRKKRQQTRRFTTKTVISFLLVLILVPLTIYFGWKADRNFYVVSLLIILYSMIPFFALFERRKPQARELVLIAVMSGIAVVSRVAFIWLPHFKPIFAIIMITGISLGPEAGFLTGAVSGFVSNFIFGQGVWTPWQMAAMGLAGFLAGLFFQKGWLPKERIPLCVFGGLVNLCIIGPILDTCTLFTMSAEITRESAAAIYLSGLPVNAIQSAATVLTLALISRPLIEKLDRVKKKYGILED
ncbi:MAG: ECF transporter S component [Bilifractor sp.]